MYSPKIEEELIPYLYRISKAKGKPMTHIVNEIIRRAIKKIKIVAPLPTGITHKDEGIGVPQNSELGGKEKIPTTYEDEKVAYRIAEKKGTGAQTPAPDVKSPQPIKADDQ